MNNALIPLWDIGRHWKYVWENALQKRLDFRRFLRVILHIQPSSPSLAEKRKPSSKLKS
jgi:hypothetical protein